MKARTEQPPITPEQQQLINAFNNAVERNEFANIAKLLVNLESIPAEYSPIRTLALKNNGLNNINHCIDMARNAILLHAKNGFEPEKIHDHGLMKEFDTTFRSALMGSEISTNNVHIYLTKHAALGVYLILVDLIYKNAVWAFASKGDKATVDKLIADHNKMLAAIKPTDAWVLKTSVRRILKAMESPTLFRWICPESFTFLPFAAAEGYLSGGHYSKILFPFELSDTSNISKFSAEAQSIIIRKLIKNNDIPLLKKLMPTCTSLETIEIALSTCQNENLPELSSSLIDLFFSNKSNLALAGALSLYIAQTGKTNIVNEFLDFRLTELKKLDPNSEAYEDMLKITEVEMAGFSNGYQLANLDLESKKINFLFSSLFSTKMSGSERQVEIFQLIDKLKSLEDIDLKISLFVDCLYKNTLVGKEFWHQYPGQATPALKWGTLNQVLSKLNSLGVDIKKLPGCRSYSLSLFGTAPTGKFGVCPSKKELEGKMPPKTIPMIVLEVNKDKNKQKKLDENDNMFKL